MIEAGENQIVATGWREGMKNGDEKQGGRGYVYTRTKNNHQPPPPGSWATFSGPNACQCT